MDQSTRASLALPHRRHAMGRKTLDRNERRQLHACAYYNDINSLSSSEAMCVWSMFASMCAHDGWGWQTEGQGRERAAQGRADAAGGLVLTVWSGGMSSDTFDPRRHTRMQTFLGLSRHRIPDSIAKRVGNLLFQHLLCGGGCSVKNEPIHTGTDLVFYKGNHRNSHGGNVQSKPCL